MKKYLLLSALSFSVQVPVLAKDILPTDSLAQKISTNPVLAETLLQSSITQNSVFKTFTLTAEKAQKLLTLHEFINTLPKETISQIPYELRKTYSESSPLYLHGILQALAQGLGEKTKDINILIPDYSFGEMKLHKDRVTLTIKDLASQIGNQTFSYLMPIPHGEIISKVALQGLQAHADLRFIQFPDAIEKDTFIIFMSSTLPMMAKTYHKNLEKIFASNTIRICSPGNSQDIFPTSAACGADGLLYSLNKKYLSKNVYIVEVDSRGLLHLSTYPGDNAAFQQRTLAVSNRVQYNANLRLNGGTSFCVPLVSNAATLLKGEFPEFDAETISELLLASALRTFSIPFPSLNITIHVQDQGEDQIITQASGETEIFLSFERVAPLYGRGILHLENARFLAQKLHDNETTLETIETLRDSMPRQHFENDRLDPMDIESFQAESVSFLLFLKKLKDNLFVSQTLLPLFETKEFAKSEKKLDHPKLSSVLKKLEKAASIGDISLIIQELGSWIEKNQVTVTESLTQIPNAGISIKDIQKKDLLDQALDKEIQTASSLSKAQAIYIIAKLKEKNLSQETKAKADLLVWKWSLSNFYTAKATYSIFFLNQTPLGGESERFVNSSFIKGFIDPIVDLLETNRDSLGEISNLFVDYMRDPEFSLSEKLLNKVTYDRFPTYALLSLLIDFIKLYKLEPLFETTQKLSSSGRLLSKALTLETPKERDALVFKEFELITPSEISGFMEDITKDYKLLFGIDEQEVGTEIKFYLAALNQAFSEAKKMMLAPKKEVN